MEETKEEPKPTEEVLCDLTAVFGTKDPCVLTESPESFGILGLMKENSVWHQYNPPRIQYCDDTNLRWINALQPDKEITPNDVNVIGEHIDTVRSYELQNLTFCKDKSLSFGEKKDTYIIEKHISSGLFGMVCICRHVTTNKMFILKVVTNREAHYGREKLLTEVINQHVISSLNGMEGIFAPRIETIGISITTSVLLYVLMEFIDGMDVFSYISSLIQVPPIHDVSKIISEAARILLEVANISDVLYKKYEFNHCDLKMDNLLIRKSDNKIMFIDFGYSTLKLGKGKHTVLKNGSKHLTTRNPTRDTTMMGIDYLTSFSGELKTRIMSFLQPLFLTIQCDVQSDPYLAGTIPTYLPHPPYPPHQPHLPHSFSVLPIIMNPQLRPKRYEYCNDHNNILATPDNIRKEYSKLFEPTTGATTTGATTGAAFGGGVRRKRASKTSKNKRTRTSKNKHMRTSRRKTLYRTNRTRTRNRTRTQFGGTLTLTNTNIDLTPFNHVSKEFYLHYLRFSANQGISLEKEVMKGILMDAVRNDNPAIWQYAIDAYLGESDPDTAIQLLRRLIALPPESREAFIQWTNTSSPEIRKFNIERKPYNVPYIPFTPFTN